MITYIKINGFKSFHHFEMEFTPLTVIAGANASGKSNLFDALKLLGRLAEETDHLKKAFKEQRGEFIELFTQYGENEYATEIEFVVEMLVNRKVKDSWGNEAELKYTRLRYELKIKRFTNSLGIEDLAVTYEHLENLKPKQDKWVRLLPEEIVENWRPNVNKVRTIPYIKTETENNRPTVLVSQEGLLGANKRFPLNNATRTVLSSFDTVDFPHVLAAKEEMRRWKFLHNPEDLRQPTHKNTGDDVISESGQNLAAVLHRIKQEELYTLREISRDFQTFLPHFVDVDVIDDTENNQYLLKLTDKDKKEYTSRVLSEGTLRILALCILEYDSKHTGLLCFEEPENGIPPFRIETMAKLLKHLSVDFAELEMPLRQVIVNTHSPVLVGMMNRWEPDLNVNIWYAEMRDRVTDIHKKQRVKLSVTSILPVINGKMPLMLSFSEPDKKLTLSKLKRYLETASNQS
ncbi:MAG: ATPase [Candidatus Parabeggiatoa sp. nov. 2]|nr:MAG: ATPase [Gammaproteobacteria bacterium]